MVQLGSGNDTLNAYVVLPPDNPAPKAAVIIFTDIYGYELNNTRLWADRLAKNDFLAVIPDFFRGDPITEATRGQMAECACTLRHQHLEIELYSRLGLCVAATQNVFLSASTDCCKAKCHHHNARVPA